MQGEGQGSIPGQQPPVDINEQSGKGPAQRRAQENQMTDVSTLPRPRALTLKAFGITDKGKVRTSNEDQFLIAELTKSMRVWQTSLPEPKMQVGDEHAHLFVVADGMGGHLAGEQASGLAVITIEQFTLNTFRWFLGSTGSDAQKVLAQFQSAISQADARILEEAAEHPELSGMGTTVTMAFSLGAQLCVVHVGDSRAYLYRDGQLDQITQDHTVTAEMVRNGILRPDEVAGHRLRHVITNVVGGPELGVRVEAHALDVQAGDRLLLCSDGLTEMVPNDAIAAALHAEFSPELAAKMLLTQASEAGGRDNITVLIVRFDPAEI
jgi:serine/threonine protein phosphatase PrpC